MLGEASSNQGGGAEETTNNQAERSQNGDKDGEITVRDHSMR